MAQTRMTKQRAVILEVLRSVTTHPTADELYGMVREHLPRISLGTIYRNLELLVNSGEILCLHHSGAQKRFDGNASPHRHIHCSRCGKIGDVFTSMPLPMPHPADAPGFFIQSVEIEFIGLCDACGTKRPEPLRT